MPSHRGSPRPPAPELTVTIEVEPSSGDRADQLAGREGPLFAAPAWLAGLGRKIRPLWRFRGAAVLLALAVAAVIVARPGQAPTVPAETSATSAPAPHATSGTAAPRPSSRTMVVPGSARPGETVTLVGYQRRGVCDATAVYLGARLLAHERIAVVDSALPDWDAVVLAVRLPVDVTPGSHLVTLVGALPGPGRGAGTCTDARQRSSVIATALLVIAPAD
jgi:hypothetical protein